MQPWLRKYNYISDWMGSIDNIYGSVYPAYPVVYYAIDKENTVWDNEYLLGGSYEKLGVGDLSGVKFKKILFFPVFGIESIQPTQDSDEKGLSFEASLISQIAFPDTYGLIPTVGDFVDMLGVMNSDVTLKPTKDIMVISNVNVEYVSSPTQFFQCRLKIANIGGLERLETQISSTWKFLEFTKSIIPKQNADFLLRIQERSEALSDSLSREIFDNYTGFYLIDNN
jgi:hypothetical protein